MRVGGGEEEFLGVTNEDHLNDGGIHSIPQTDDKRDFTIYYR